MAPRTPLPDQHTNATGNLADVVGPPKPPSGVVNPSALATGSRTRPYYTHERPDDRGLHGANPPRNPVIK